MNYILVVESDTKNHNNCN